MLLQKLFGESPGRRTPAAAWRESVTGEMMKDIYAGRRTCRWCGEKLPASKRYDAVFCDKAKCRVYWGRWIRKREGAVDLATGILLKRLIEGVDNQHKRLYVKKMCQRLAWRLEAMIAEIDEASKAGAELDGLLWGEQLKALMPEE